METGFAHEIGFPLEDMQSAYYVGEQAGLPLATTARYIREVEFSMRDPNVIEDAWNILIMRHEMLRTIIDSTGLQQTLEAVPRYRLKVFNMRGELPAIAQRKNDDLISEMRNEDLPLGRWPQFDVRVVINESRLRLLLRFNLWTIDALSMQIMLSEMLAICDDPQLVLPPVKNTFRRYIESRKGVNNERSTAYWFERAQSLPLGPDLPLAIAPEEIETPTFKHLSSTLSVQEWAQFSEFAKKNRVTPTFAVIAAYASVLAEWGRHRHFSLTILFSRRPFFDDVEQVVGNFGTTLLLEIDARLLRSFGELARSIQFQFWKDVKHIDVSGIATGREMNRLNGSPLRLIAPVTFTSLGGSALGKEQQEKLEEFQHLSSRLDVPQVLLDHQVTEEPQGHLTINWDFVEQAFYPGVVEDMFLAFGECLTKLSSDKELWETLHFKVELPNVHNALWTELNTTDYLYPDVLLDDLIDESISLNFDRVAIISGDKSLTYGELWKETGQLAARLYEGGHLGKLVAVILPKGCEQVIATLGIVRSGAAYVPIDPSLPLARQNELLIQSGATAIVTSGPLAAEQVWIDGPQVLVVGGDELRLGPDIASYELSRTTADIAYVIFTSGSTGTPKGVVIDHRGAVNTILDINRRLDVGAEDRVLALSSLSFDLSVFDIFGLLAVGGTVVIPTSQQMGSPADWCDLVLQHKITLWNSVPALFQLAVDASRSSGLQMITLRNVMMSGDWIPLHLPEQGRNAAPSSRFFSLGGATEVSIWSVIHEIVELDTLWQTIPYGKPLANQQAHILDDQFQLCPLWKTGELYFSGKGVALGYHRDEKKTNERFLHNVINGKTLYRTGDLARFRPDGNIEFLGRCDHQIKIRGFRIELGEIEAVIASCHGVAGSIVKVFGETDIDKQLAAFVICDAEEKEIRELIKKKLSDTLPRYMIPSSIYVIRALPLTPNGKINHTALTEIHKDSVALQTREILNEGIGESSSIRALGLLWEKILGIDSVSASDSFFALGGTSFQALQLAGKIKEKFGVSLTLDSFSSTVTLQEMARRLDGNVSAPGTVSPLILLRDSEGSSVSAPSLTLFCIHAVGGSAHSYLPLCQELPANIKVFGIQRTRGMFFDNKTIEELATSYAELIKRASPDGPIAILGWSMGAAIAHETCKILVAAGREIKPTFLIDPYYRPTGLLSDVSQMKLLDAFCNDLSGISGRPYTPQHEVSPGVDAYSDRAVFDQHMHALIEQQILPQDVSTDHLHDVFQIFSRNLTALLEYSPDGNDSTTLVFRARQALADGTSTLRPWSPRNSDEYIFDCDHFSIMRTPYVERIAHIVSERLSSDFS